MRQQRNMSQTKEQGKTLTEELSGDNQPIWERVKSNHRKEDPRTWRKNKDTEKF